MAFGKVNVGGGAKSAQRLLIAGNYRGVTWEEGFNSSNNASDVLNIASGAAFSVGGYGSKPSVKSAVTSIPFDLTNVSQICILVDGIIQHNEGVHVVLAAGASKLTTPINDTKVLFGEWSISESESASDQNDVVYLSVASLTGLYYIKVGVYVQSDKGTFNIKMLGML